MRLVTSLLLLMTVVCTYARSFSDIDIPDPPQIKSDSSEKNISVKETGVKNQKSEDQEVKDTSDATTKLSTSSKPISSTKAPTTLGTTSTTLDPWEEFCKEACEEGLAGPECDCPEHPIGRRSVDNKRHRRSAGINTTESDGNYSLKRYYNSKAHPTLNLKVKRLIMKYCKLVCDYGLKDDICRCGGPPNKPDVIDGDPGCTNNGSAIAEGNSTQVPCAAEGTTKDPLEEFCETACSEGQGTLACNCHDHIIGRRRRSLRNILTYHLESPQKKLDSKSHQRYQRSLGEYQDITHLESALPRVALESDSVHSQDLNVNFPFRTLPEMIKAPKERFTRVQLQKDRLHTQDLEVNFPYKRMTEESNN